MKVALLVVTCSVLSSILTWLFVRESYDAGYDLVGSICNATAVELNTRVLQIEDDADARCHLSRHTRWMVEDLREVEIPDQYIIGGPGLPAVTSSVIDDAIALYEKTGIAGFASTCETECSLF